MAGHDKVRGERKRSRAKIVGVTTARTAALDSQRRQATGTVPSNRERSPLLVELRFSP